MTDEEIVALAFKHWLCKSSGEDFEGAIHSIANVIAFARAIEARKREEHAQVCERLAQGRYSHAQRAYRDCADAIREKEDEA